MLSFCPHIRTRPATPHKMSMTVKPKQILTCLLNSELSREKMWARIHLIPLLQAEEDRDQVRRHYADKAREKDLLGVETRVYNTDKFVRPTFSMTPEISK